MRLTSRFGYVNQIRRDRPLTHEELMHHVPGIFGEDRHTSCSER
ncbi:replication regulatory RepB family protein, partial [Escherichia coli]|nr:replication regulatory RepB family protein [Escherichia coli]MBV7143537.1 replication regulatory RepB family protein [Escherichia coli]MBV7148404.1 replication regulatory RepB family protein [Escherichia coli]